jgi:DNA-binding NarL/FixJ family response regulator
MLRILLVDDHAIVRSGIRALLGRIPDAVIVGEADDGASALAFVERETPDLVIMDIGMKGMNGLEATRRLSGRVPLPKVLMVSMFGGEEYVVQALAAGADGYLLKDSASDQLEQAVRCVMRGEQFLDPRISRELLELLVRRMAENGSPAQILTARQREILQLVAEGHTTKEIAYRLGVSGKTVETHRAQIMDRLQIHDVAGLVRYAIRTGLTTLDS